MQVDGGWGSGNVKEAAAAGANCIVSGYALFAACEPAKDISYCRKIVEESQQNSYALNQSKEAQKKKLEEELSEALANLEKQKDETIKAFDAISEMVKVFKKALPV
ncbi:hypothetical protein BVC80_1837g346 [Macleaya cordata]|uniref:Uncharacterized protein n=1 Tax=Macleaya cordata TaxID=56857 RepID=A0A200R4A6_MACCD|nr:hypothetical protein BVC80_1837g346 [Macleaya cordata]